MRNWTAGSWCSKSKFDSHVINVCTSCVNVLVIHMKYIDVYEGLCHVCDLRASSSPLWPSDQLKERCSILQIIVGSIIFSELNPVWGVYLLKKNVQHLLNSLWMACSYFYVYMIEARARARSGWKRTTWNVKIPMFSRIEVSMRSRGGAEGHVGLNLPHISWMKHSMKRKGKVGMKRERNKPTNQELTNENRWRRRGQITITWKRSAWEWGYLG